MDTVELDLNEKYLYFLYKAKNTLWYFIEQLKALPPEISYTAVKFINEDNFYVWLENIEYKHNSFSGTLVENNEQKCIPVGEVIDWMFVQNNRLIGNYTMRYYRDGLSEDERMNFDIGLGLKIDNGNDFFYPDLSTPEGALITLENFCTQNSLDGALSCKDFYKEARNLLIESYRNVNEELINEKGELLQLVFIKKLQSEMPNFENIERAFERLSFNEKANIQLIEEKIIFSDGSEDINKFWIAKNKEGQWKVLNLIN